MTNFTKIYNEYKPQIEKLNRQFKKLQKHTQGLNYTDLKLYDVAFYVGDDERLLNHFENFCHFEYEFFNEWLKENMLETEYIGRTSSFYFHGKNIYDFDIYDMKNDNNIFDTLAYGIESETEALFNSDSLEHFYYDLENYLHYNLQDSEDLENLDNELDSTLYEIEEYLIEYYREIKDIRKAYKWLESYKDNQIENFKDFVANNEL